MKFINNGLLNCNNKLIINYRNYKNEASGLQVRRFQNCFKDILDQRRRMGQINPVCSPRHT